MIHWKNDCVSRRLTFVLVLAAFFAMAAAASATENASESEARLRQTVTYLAADALEGRGVGTEGLNKAADYVAAQFARIGLRTGLFHDTPFQEFEITVSAEQGEAEHN